MTDWARGLLGDLRTGDVAFGLNAEVMERDDSGEVDVVSDRLRSPGESLESSALS